MRIQHLRFYCLEQGKGGGALKGLCKTTFMKMSLTSFSEGSSGAEAAVRLALVPTQAVWLMPQNAAGVTSIKKRVGLGRGVEEEGENKPFVQG